MQYNYISGTGNDYQIKDGFLKYIPMTKEYSSSGIYDGGESFRKELSKIDLMRIVDVLERAIWSSEDHIDKREMGSGTIIKRLGDERKMVYLKRNSDTNSEVMELMKSFHS